MTMSLSVRETLQTPHHYQRGRFRLSVRGILLVTPDTCRIYDDNSGSERPNQDLSMPDWKQAALDGDFPGDISIRIDDETFLPRLVLEIPPSDDPQILYFDVAWVCASTRLDPNEIVLEDVWGVRLFRGDTTLRALDNS